MIRRLENRAFMLSGKAGLLLLLLAACTPAGVGTEDDVLTGKVVSIQDGDSITVLHAGRQVPVRLWGIDCPERYQPFSRRARQHTSDAVFGKTVRVEVRETDRYDRIVGTVYTADGRELNAELLREGLAWWYRRYAPGRRDYEALEEEARRAKRGLWTDADPVPPWEWRRRKPREE